MPETKTLTRLCPACGADRKELTLSLLEEHGSDNHLTASRIIENCPDCQETIREVGKYLNRDTPTPSTLTREAHRLICHGSLFRSGTLCRCLRCHAEWNEG